MNRPVYKHKCRDLYLFVGPTGAWRVGPDTSTFRKTSLKNSRKPTPSTPPRSGWQYWDEEWLSDNTIKVGRANSRTIRDWSCDNETTQTPRPLTTTSPPTCCTTRRPKQRPEVLYLSSTGSSAWIIDYPMLFIKIKAMYNGYPIYGNAKGTYFLFVDDNKYWGISRSPGGFAELMWNSAWPTPSEPPSTGSQYKGRYGGWEQDQYISLTKY